MSLKPWRRLLRRTINSTIMKTVMKPDFRTRRHQWKIKAKDLYKLTKTTVSEWWAMDPFRQSAIIAYYAVFSLPALLVIIITVAGFVFGTEAVNSKILEQVKDTMGPQTAEQI